MVANVVCKLCVCQLDCAGRERFNEGGGGRAFLCVSVSVYQCISVSVYRCIGVSVCRGISVSGYQCVGVSVCRGVGVIRGTVRNSPFAIYPGHKWVNNITILP